MSAATRLSSLLLGNSPVTWERIDQGQDLQTTPGAALGALGDGYVLRIANDPSGFGPDYPVVHFTSGLLAGHDVYYGHTDTALQPGQRFKAGDTIAYTSKTGHNAPAGWAEIGMWPPAQGPNKMTAGRGISTLLRNSFFDRVNGGLDPLGIGKGSVDAAHAVEGAVSSGVDAAGQIASGISWVEGNWQEALIAAALVAGGLGLMLYGTWLVFRPTTAGGGEGASDE